jgi:hypothetical protein
VVGGLLWPYRLGRSPEQSSRTEQKLGKSSRGLRELADVRGIIGIIIKSYRFTNFVSYQPL